jgi:dihydrofolate reductase
MRTVTYGGACSLDGFITAADGSVDWLHFSRDVEDAIGKYWATIDTLVMGRKTWAGAPAAAGAAEGSEGGSGAGPSTSGITTYVFSRTLKRISQRGVHLVSGNAGEFVRELKAKRGKGICVMGGSNLAQSLFEADVIDEVGLNIHPVLLGSGTPLFLDAGRRIHLELLENRTIDGGCVLATYRVKRKGRRRS